MYITHATNKQIQQSNKEKPFANVYTAYYTLYSIQADMLQYVQRGEQEQNPHLNYGAYLRPQDAIFKIWAVIAA